MATVQICDKCQKILKYGTDKVEIKYSFKAEGHTFPTTKNIHLCADCYREIFGSALDDFIQEEEQWIDE